MAGDDTTEVRAKAPVAPTDVFSPSYNEVDRTQDHTDTSSGTGINPSKFQSEVWSRDDGKVNIPPGSKVEVDGRVVDGDKVIIKHADVVNIYQGGDRDERVVRVEDNGDYIGTNYPEFQNRGPGRIGHLPYAPYEMNPNSYHAMRQRFGSPDIVFNANLGGHRDCGDRHVRHPRFEFEYGHDRYPGTPPFFPPMHGHRGGPRISIDIGGRHGGGIQIGDLNIGGRFSFPIGGGNDRFDSGWNQPRFDISANIDTDRRHHVQPHRENFHDSQHNTRALANRQRFQERMQAAREDQLARRHRHFGDHQQT